MNDDDNLYNQSYFPAPAEINKFKFFIFCFNLFINKSSQKISKNATKKKNKQRQKISNKKTNNSVAARGGWVQVIGG